MTKFVLILISLTFFSFSVFSQDYSEDNKKNTKTIPENALIIKH